MNNYRNRFEFSYFEINPSGFVFGTKFTVNPSYVLEKGRSMFSEKPTFPLLLVVLLLLPPFSRLSTTSLQGLSVHKSQRTTE